MGMASGARPDQHNRSTSDRPRPRRKEPFATPPQSVLTRLMRPGITGEDRQVFGAIMARQWRFWKTAGQPVPVKLDDLAHDTGLSRSQVCRALNHLEAVGRLKRSRYGKGGGPRGWTRYDLLNVPTVRVEDRGKPRINCRANVTVDTPRPNSTAPANCHIPEISHRTHVNEPSEEGFINKEPGVTMSRSTDQGDRQGGLGVPVAEITTQQGEEDEAWESNGPDRSPWSDEDDVVNGEDEDAWEPPGDDGRPGLDDSDDGTALEAAPEAVPA